MKERPILFSGPMIRALLENRKSQTRRTAGLNVINRQPDSWSLNGIETFEDENLWVGFTSNAGDDCIKCPYGRTGDHLWARECWRSKCGEQHPECVIYNATDEDKNRHVLNGGGKFRPSIFMPRWASRITLEITDIRVERLQEITTADCYAEGVENPHYRRGSIGGDFSVLNVMFPEGWDAINKRRGYGWNVNPWVWVIAFKRVTP